MAGALTISTLNNDTGPLATQNGMTGIPKAWVNFNGTGTPAIRGSFNVSSITDNGTGDYSINFTTALANANFATSVCGDIGGADDFVIACTDDRTTARTTSIVRIRLGNSAGTAVDSNIVAVSVFSS
jgi:hypothetical protein